MKTNYTKTKVLHFRNGTVMRSTFQFKCGESIIEYTDKYKYLGLVVNGHLDYSVTAKYVAQSATRALGLLLRSGRTTISSASEQVSDLHSVSFKRSDSVRALTYKRLPTELINFAHGGSRDEMGQ